MSLTRQDTPVSGHIFISRLKDLLERSRRRLFEYRPRFRDKRFWVVQGLIIVIAVLHDYAEAIGLMSNLGVLYFLTLALFYIPMVYAALNFGLVGSIATALWIMVITIPDWAIWHHGLEERLGVILSLAVINGLAIFIGQRVDREQSARHYAEAAGTALRSSEMKYRSLFESSPVPVLVLDPAGAILETNPAANRLFSIETATFKSMHLDDLIGLENSRKLLKFDDDGEQQIETIAIKLRDGSNIHLKPTLTQLSNEQEDDVIQAVLRDVTDEYNQQVGLRAYAAFVTRTQEEERQRIARELHDDTIQSLVLLCRRLDSVETSGEAIPSSFTHELSEARKATEEVVKGLREFTTALRPPALDDLGLITALRRLLLELKDRTGIDARLEVVGEYERLPSETELGIFRIAQEALWNAERHAKASRITVTISFTEDEVKVEVLDNGVGFIVPSPATDSAATRQLGIIGMQERAKLFGGSLEIQSHVGSGTKVITSVPVPDGAAKVPDPYLEK